MFLKRTKINTILLVILLTSALTEVINYFLLVYKYQIQSIVNCWIVIHHFLWLYLFQTINKKSNASIILLIIFLVYSVINFIALEGISKLNYSTFLFGALVYVIIFLFESFKRLKSEDFKYFYSNYYILLFSPILFFFGTSLMFGFREKEITTMILMGNFTLYQTIIYTSNIFYYSLINLYIFKSIIYANN